MVGFNYGGIFYIFNKGEQYAKKIIDSAIRMVNMRKKREYFTMREEEGKG